MIHVLRPIPVERLKLLGFGNDTLTSAPPESQPDILVDSPRDWAAALSSTALANPARKY
jgi:hypothetical protein